MVTLHSALRTQEIKQGQNIQHQQFLLLSFCHNKTTKRVKIQTRIRSDLYNLAGSGSISGSMDPDPGSKENCDKLAWKSTKIIRIYSLKKSPFGPKNINNKLINYQKKTLLGVLYLYRINKEKTIGIYSM